MSDSSTTTTRGTRNRTTGKVVRLGAAKTVVVEVSYNTVHAKYRKTRVFTKHFAVHCDGQPPAVGDVVEIVSCRPISKTKRHRLGRVVSAGLAPVTIPGQDAGQV